MTTPTKKGSLWESHVSVPTDGEGFFGRQCPAEDCRAFFKLAVAEFKAAPDDLRLSCPVCGQMDEAQAFLTDDQMRRAKAAAREMAQGVMRAALDEAFSGLVRSSGPVSITYRPGPAYAPKALPTYVEEKTIRTFTCPGCGLSAVIYDLLTVCPYCGPATPPRAVLDDSFAVMGRLLGLAENLPPDDRRELQAMGGLTVLSERALSGAVAGLQNFAKQLHARSGMPAPQGNPWQNVDRLSRRWQEDFGVDLAGQLSVPDIALLRLGFSRRHVLEHNNGMADQKYVAESGDRIALGRRIRVTPAFVREFAAVAVGLADALEATCPSGGSPASGPTQNPADDVSLSAANTGRLPASTMEGLAMGTEGKAQRRSAYLYALWQKSDGRASHIDLGMDTARSVGIADEAELLSVVRYLEEEGLVEIQTTGPGISITHAGVQEVEQSLDSQSEEGQRAAAREQDRDAFMKKAYQLVDGDDMTMFNFRDVATALSWDEDRSLVAADYLVEEGYVKWYTMGGNLVLTHEGIKLVEAAG